MQVRIPRFLFVLALNLLIVGTASAQTPGVSPRLGSGARPLALGEAFTAIANDPSAAFWNPAGLAILESSEVSLGYRRLDSALNLDTGSIAFHPWSERPIVLGLSASLLNRAGVPAEDVFGSFVGDVGAYEFAGRLNLAATLHPRVLFGIAAGGLVSTLATSERVQTWTGSTGILLDAWGNNVGIALRGLTPKIADEKIQVPYMYRMSAGVARHLVPGVLLTVQADRDRGADVILAGGTEWRHRTGIALRAGARRVLADAPQNGTYSGGMGYHKDKLRADYAVLLGEGRSPEHVLSMGVQFGLYELPDRLSEEPEEAEPWHVPPVQAQSVPEVLEPPEVSTVVETPNPAPAMNIEEPSSSSEETLADPVAKLRIQQPWKPIEPADESNVYTQTPSTEPIRRNETSVLERDPDVLPPKSVRLPAPRQQITEPSIQPERRKAPVQELESTPPTLPLDSDDNGRFVVRAGVYLEVDEAAIEVARFYRAQLRPRLERRGELYVVVLRRCQTRAEAETWLQRARSAGIHCNIDEE